MKQRILFLAANPAGTTALQLDEEARAIEEEIRRSSQRDALEFVARLAARPIDLLRALRELKPTIVHVAGHAMVDGIYLVDDRGQPAHVTREALLETFDAAGQSVQVVVLNGCSTDPLVEALCEFVPVCVGTPAAIRGVAARMFSVGFYGALASGESAARATRHGRAAMHLEATGDHDRPRLHHRHDIDPDALVTVADDPTAWPPGEVCQVCPGPFVLDPQTLADPPVRLSLPPALRRRDRTELHGARAPSMAANPRPRRRVSEVASAIANYRARKTRSFVSWDLRGAGPQPTVGHRPVEITLDDMYIPLRFDAQFDPSKLDRGTVVTADDLVVPRRPQVVIGSAGSGKTTWMRWTFRRLIRDPRTVPFFLELRAIAAAWNTPHDAARPIDSYLADELATCRIADAEAVVAALLADPLGPQPVILIDGWDELGAQGERLRERLVEFCGAFPRVTVVVSSRPYGDTRPAGAQAFETVYLQPLSDDDVRRLATRFHRHIHGLDEAAGTRATQEFMAALAAAPEARALTGTALLLTMMLLLGRDGPLPDRRHKLYSACLRSLLLHRVTPREREGAPIDPDQWRPEDGEARLRVVAELAYAMQVEGYKTSRRAAIIRAWDAVVDLLVTGMAHRAGPADWTPQHGDGFLRWLVATAGVLVDRSDGSVHFAHLSFQEHLAAYHLYCTCEGDERAAIVRDHMEDHTWWETLRLWAGLTCDKAPDKLTQALAALREGEGGYWLAGMIFADGTGQRSDFDAWVAELPGRISSPFSCGDSEDCARAWGACKQSDRRTVLAERLAATRDSLCWLEAIWHADWCWSAGLDVACARAIATIGQPIASVGAAALARVLFGGAASWPDGGELALLRLWPSARSRIGVQLQTATSLGAQLPEVGAILRALVSRRRRSRLDEDHVWVQALGRCFGWEFVRDFVRDFGWDFVRDFVRYFERDFGRYPIRDLVRYFVRYIVRDFDLDGLQDFSANRSSDFSRYFARYHVSDVIRYFVRDVARGSVRDIVRYLGRDFGRDLGLAEPVLSAPWLPGFGLLELGSSLGRAAPRAALAHGELCTGVPLLALFRLACRASFAPGDASLCAETAQACEAFDGDPLWPALARHVARISTTADRTLLEDLARHPEQREPPLSWGLQCYVRGDLVLDDDSVVELDDLCAQLGLAPLPVLDAMPDELEIPLDEPWMNPPRNPEDASVRPGAERGTVMPVTR